MAASLWNRVWCNTTTTGTGTITIGSAIAGYQTFAAAGVTNGATVSYTIVDGSSWETGRGVYNSAAGTLTRVLLESSTGALINLSGAATVAIQALAEDFNVFVASGGGHATGLVPDPGPVAGSANFLREDGTWQLPVIPPGTVMCFFQASAPTGWTQVTTHNDKALRVVSGTGGGSGGTNSFSSTFAQTATGTASISGSTDGHVLTIAEMPSHSHSISGASGASPENAGSLFVKATDAGSARSPGAIVSTGGNGAHSHTLTSVGAHSHTMDMRTQFIDVILASKN